MWFVGCTAVCFSLRVNHVLLLPSDARFWHTPFLDLNPIRNAAAQVVRAFGQHGNLLGCWVQPQSFEILCKALPKEFLSISEQKSRRKHTY